MWFADLVCNAFAQDVGRVAACERHAREGQGILGQHLFKAYTTKDALVVAVVVVVGGNGSGGSGSSGSSK